jgi:hypothetical protein
LLPCLFRDIHHSQLHGFQTYQVMIHKDTLYTAVEEKSRIRPKIRLNLGLDDLF